LAGTLQTPVAMIRLLLVDDDAFIRLALRDAFESAGVEVTEAGDGEQALALTRARPFDLVLCDVHMPRMDGLTLLRRVRERWGGPFIVMTTFGDGEDVALARREGATDCIGKPFDPEDFVRTVLVPLEACLAVQR